MKTLLLFFFATSFIFSRARSQCTNFTFSGGRTYEKCADLGKLGALLHWTYNAQSRNADLAFRAPQGAGGYVAWALNPTGSGMRGAQTLVALQNSSGAMWAYTTDIQNTSPDMKPSAISVGVSKLSAEIQGSYMIIYADVTLPGNSTTINHVWQVSNMISDGLPAGHGGGDNTLSLGSIDFVNGGVTSGGSFKKKNVHGVISAVAWGVLMPMGVILARYVKVFADPAWFYLHVACQVSAYGLGVASLATGLKLGNESVGVTHKAHRGMGIALFCMATLQVFALLLRPNKDHKYRIYWNVYHHGIGYLTILISVFNIFEGFDILDPEKKWKNAYIGVLGTLVGIALILEVLTWTIVLRRKRQVREDKSHNGRASRVI